ncbi:CDP-alcohol phosphatidyltransferase family protein [bacterium]|nr:CDP-alcohol phosphatidyltransferase family protein [bacterium]
MFTISNFISFSRILLVFPILYFLSLETDNGNKIALAFIFLAVFTDFLDGFLARKLNQISETGKIVDPLADKLCAVSIIGYLAFFRDFPFWFFCIVSGRDVLILLASFFVIRKQKMAISSNLPGKLTINALALSGIFYILELREIANIFVYAGTFLVFASLFSYGKIFFKIMKTPFLPTFLLTFLVVSLAFSQNETMSEEELLSKSRALGLLPEKELTSKIHTNKELGFSFELLPNWETTTLPVFNAENNEQSSYQVEKFTKKIEDSSGGQTSFFEILQINDLYPLESFKEKYLKANTKINVFSTAVTSDILTEINGVKACQIEYFENSANEKLKKILYIFDFPQKKIVVNFSCSSVSSTYFVSEFEEMISSIRFFSQENFEPSQEILELNELFISQTHKFSLKYPSGWKKKQGFEDAQKLVEFYETEGSSSKILVFLFGENEPDFKKNVKTSFSESVGFSNGVSFKILKYAKGNLTFKDFIFSYGGKFFSIRCQAETKDFSVLEPTFNEIPTKIIWFNSQK